MKPEDQTPTTDEQLAKQIAQTLDTSLQSIEVEARTKLLQVRQQALSGKKSIKPQLNVLIGIAAAAGIAAVVVLPGYWSNQSSFEIEDEFSYLSIDPQLLDDMEMLQALGEIIEDTGSES